MKDFAAEFEETEYPPLAAAFLKDTIQDLQKNHARAKLLSDMDSVINRVVKLQQSGYPAVSHLLISMMYTSVYFDRPRLRLDFYHGQWLLEEPVYSEYIDVPWLFAHWQAHKDAVAEAAKNQRALVRGTHRENMCWRAYRMLEYWLAGAAKYWLADLKESLFLRRLALGESFYILFGEYMDWQEPVFGILPEIDIFNCKTKDSLRFRHFEKCRYSKKKFLATDLSASTFKECVFENCLFDKTDFSDTLFDHCEFSQSEFNRTVMPGALFLESQLKQIAFYDVIAEPISQDYARQNWYRNLEFGGCVMEGIHLRNCRFPNALLTDCMIRDIEITGGDLTGSAFEQRRAENQPEQGDE